MFYIDNEIEAELARGRLESEGIAAQVRFTARAGYPRYAAGAVVSAPLTTWEVLVPEADEPEARRVLADREPAARTSVWRRSLVMRAFAILAIVSLLFPLVYGAIQQLRLLF